MSRIGRETFVSEMSSGLETNNLSPEAQAALKKAGIDQGKLAAIAGQDGVIKGQDELDALFTLIDTKDRNGSYQSIETTKTNGEATVSGQLYEALKGERERARLGSPAAGAAKPQASDREPLGNARKRPDDKKYEAGMAALRNDGFTDIHIAKNTPYFNQVDPPWGDDSYPKVNEKNSTRTVREAGCAPTALAIADATLRGGNTTPSDTAKFAVDRKHSGQLHGAGSDTHPMARDWAKEHGLTYRPATSKNPNRKEAQRENVDTIRDGLRNGGVALVGVGKGHFANEAHVVVINGYAKDKDGKEWFFVVNPGRRDQRDAKAGVDNTVVQNDGLHHGAGRLRISREQLEKELRHGMVLSRAE
jgi:hypothetical protein